MISMKEWMELVNYKITEGSAYGWSCYGPNSYSLSSWNGVHGTGGWSADIVFSTKTQKVYEVTLCDYTNNRAYRMINPKNVEKHNQEATTKSVLSNQAWDDVNYTDLEVDDDFIQKCLAIVAGDEYSTDVSIPLDWSDEDMLKYMTLAHEAGMSFNDYVQQALRTMIDKFRADPELMKAKAAKWKEEHDQ